MANRIDEQAAARLRLASAKARDAGMRAQLAVHEYQAILLEVMIEYELDPRRHEITDEGEIVVRQPPTVPGQPPTVPGQPP